MSESSGRSINLGETSNSMPQAEASRIVRATLHAKLSECAAGPGKPFVHLDNGIRLIDKSAFLNSWNEESAPPGHFPEIIE